MADTAYVRALSRRELRNRRQERVEARREQIRVLSALNSLQRNGGVYEEPEVSLTTDIPKALLPKKTGSLTAAASSTIKAACCNPAYEADLKGRSSKSPDRHRPMVSLDQPLPLRWEIAHKGKNDNTAVQSSLAWVSGKTEPPAGLFKPSEENRRTDVLHKKEAEKAKRIELRKAADAFEYHPKVTKLGAGEEPRVLSLIPPPNVDAKRPTSASSLHAKPFR